MSIGFLNFGHELGHWLEKSFTADKLDLVQTTSAGGSYEKIIFVFFVSCSMDLTINGLPNKRLKLARQLWVARSLRLTETAAKMSGSSAAGYKRIQRFVKQVDPRTALWRLFAEQAEFVIGDPAEIERPQARKTAYVGTLKAGKGLWALSSVSTGHQPPKFWDAGGKEVALAISCGETMIHNQVW